MLQQFDDYDSEDYERSHLTYNQRNDHEPGYIYLFRAKGYHGLFPGLWLSRCKIGLSRNPNARADRIESNQPGHDIEILHTVYVDDMADTEHKLHKYFAGKNVHLNKSREYFDLYPYDIQIAKFLMNWYGLYQFGVTYKIALWGVGIAFILGVLTGGVMVNQFNNQVVEEVRNETNQKTDR